MLRIIGQMCITGLCVACTAAVMSGVNWLLQGTFAAPTYGELATALVIGVIYELQWHRDGTVTNVIIAQSQADVIAATTRED